ncbi:MAG: CRISPR system precrRNA processing endoribonuclease RAMP protein Cas6 [Promethearchaeia archaeon]
MKELNSYLKDINFKILSFLLKFRALNNFQLSNNVVYHLRNYLRYALRTKNCYYSKRECKDCGLKNECAYYTMFGVEIFFVNQPKKYNIFTRSYRQQEFKTGTIIPIIFNLFDSEISNFPVIISNLFLFSEQEGIGKKNEQGYEGKIKLISGYIRDFNNFRFKSENFIKNSTFIDIRHRIFNFNQYYSKWLNFFLELNSKNNKEHLIQIRFRSPYSLKFNKKLGILENFIINIFKKLLNFSNIQGDKYNKYLTFFYDYLSNLNYDIQRYINKREKFFWYSFSTNNYNMIWINNVKIDFIGYIPADLMTILKFSEISGIGRMTSFGLGYPKIKFIIT